VRNSAQTTAQVPQEEVVNFIVKIRIINNNVDLRPGMSCTAYIEVEKKNDVLSVPIQSVTIREEEKEEEGDETGNENLSMQNKSGKDEKPQEVVFIIDNGVAKKKSVKAGISDDAYIEITEGITEGEQVVKGSFKAINSELEDDMKVKIEEKKKLGKKEDSDE
jgi:HlyD family secretion protein